MDETSGLPINIFDAGVILIVLVSALFAYARGFVREVLSIGGWVGAIFATIHGFAYLKPYTREFIESELFADLSTGVLIFVVSLIVLTYISHSISRKVQDSMLNALDRALGFLFGLVRGAVVVCLAYMALGLVLSEKELPTTIVEARSMDLIKPGTELLAVLLPENASSEAISDATTKAGQRAKELFAPDKKLYGAEEIVNDLISPKPKSETKTESGAYGRKERQDMERLIDSSKTAN